MKSYECKATLIVTPHAQGVYLSAELINVGYLLNEYNLFPSINPRKVWLGLKRVIIEVHVYSLSEKRDTSILLSIEFVEEEKEIEYEESSSIVIGISDERVFGWGEEGEVLLRRYREA
nr:MAG TPA: hypothetical protein [Caudoviricetes sp.]